MWCESIASDKGPRLLFVAIGGVVWDRRLVHRWRLIFLANRLWVYNGWGLVHGGCGDFRDWWEFRLVGGGDLGWFVSEIFFLGSCFLGLVVAVVVWVCCVVRAWELEREREREREREGRLRLIMWPIKRVRMRVWEIKSESESLRERGAVESGIRFRVRDIYIYIYIYIERERERERVR